MKPIPHYWDITAESRFFLLIMQSIFLFAELPEVEKPLHSAIIWQNCMKKDFPMLIVDGKGDTGKGSILDVLTQLNKRYRKKIYCINLTNPSLSDTYNPFFNTSPTVAKDMLINMTDWSEEHYKVNAERYLQRLIC